MKLKIEINLDNDAFQHEAPSIEINKILRHVQQLIDNIMLIELNNKKLLDSNGNVCGSIKLSKGK